jgi:hypothetical protein
MLHISRTLHGRKSEFSIARHDAQPERATPSDVHATLAAYGLRLDNPDRYPDHNMTGQN